MSFIKLGEQYSEGNLERGNVFQACRDYQLDRIWNELET